MSALTDWAVSLELFFKIQLCTIISTSVSMTLWSETQWSFDKSQWNNWNREELALNWLTWLLGCTLPAQYTFSDVLAAQRGTEAVRKIRQCLNIYQNRNSVQTSFLYKFTSLFYKKANSKTYKQKSELTQQKRELANLFEQRMNASQFGDLMASVLQSITDAGRECRDLWHVGGKVIHLILHLFEVVLHLVHWNTPSIIL